jgi:hypothetical protein
MMGYDNYQVLAQRGDMSMAPFMWFGYILVVIVLILSAFALWKYISKK